MADTLELLLAAHKDSAVAAEKRKRWIQVNILALAGCVIAMILWYAKVTSHMENATIHPDREAQERFVDQRLALKEQAVIQRLDMVAEQQVEAREERKELSKKFDALSDDVKNEGIYTRNVVRGGRR